jgi:hypothetical protein
LEPVTAREKAALLEKEGMSRDVARSIAKKDLRKLVRAPEDGEMRRTTENFVVLDITKLPASKSRAELEKEWKEWDAKHAKTLQGDALDKGDWIQLSSLLGSK